MDKRIETFFADYGKSFSALALQKNAALYADSFMAATPKGAMVQSRDVFNEKADEAAEYYRKVGQKSAEILWMNETWFGPDYVMVTVHWGAHFEKLEAPYEFDVSYLLQMTGNTPRIILFISHQDEEEAMKEVARLQASS